MQKNILLLTPIYPASDLPYNTPVVHYFTKEWAKMGYNVHVIHYLVNFPKIVHLLARPFHAYLESKFASVVRYTQAKEKEYDWEGVHVIRIPLLKYAPHIRYKQRQIDQAYNRTIEYCENKGVKPDVIISHWVNPQYEIMGRLKIYFNVSTCFICHDDGTDLKTIYSKEADQYIQSTDVFGYRSDYIKRKFENAFNVKSRSFMCYSGIPERYIEDIGCISRDFKDVRNFIFVGTFIKRKYPAELLLALKRAFEDKPFQMSYVGMGREESLIKKYASKLDAEQKTVLLGRVKRDDVVKLLDANDVFVMNSKSETFGLVYLEAMARGCITIASYKEGFDGIIKHGVNGFLCEAGDIESLADVISTIRSLSPKELKKISFNAIQTAKELTDTKVAKYYIESVLGL